MEYLRRAAQHISDQGRGPDDNLMHVTRNELRYLGQLHPSGELPRNPRTGLPEAGFFEDILPTIGGLGVTLLTGGAAAPLWGALASGGLTAATTGDLGKGIMSGLLSYGAGSALNSLAGQGANAAATSATQAANAGTAAATNAATNTAANTATNAATQTAARTPGAWAGDAISRDFAIMPKDVGSMGIGEKFSFAGDALSNDPLGALKGTFVDNAMKTTLPLGVGLVGSMGQQEMNAPKEPTSAELQRKYPEQFPDARRVVTPPSTYRPGLDPEFDYFEPMAAGGGVHGYYAKGGIADANPKASVKANIEAEAKMALLDHHPKAKEALRRYADMFGEDALKALTDQMSSMGGRIRGAGGGLDDLIPGTIEGRKEVRLADGEFVVPADVVSHLGDGSSDHGVRKLTEMMDRIRKIKTGTTKQAGHIKDKKVLPA
jgi:hypothetical protein